MRRKRSDEVVERLEEALEDMRNALQRAVTHTAELKSHLYEECEDSSNRQEQAVDN